MLTGCRKSIACRAFVSLMTIYGQTQELSKEWFMDLEAEKNPAEAAAALLSGQNVLVIFAQDDEAVAPFVSQGGCRHIRHGGD